MLNPVEQMNFRDFFQTATKNLPYDYQCRLACGERGKREESEWLAGGTRCQSQLINIPTGLGKTAAVVLAWLWNRVALPSEMANDQIPTTNPSLKREAPWPRRLVYCLPMRTLVEQTEKEVRKWLGGLLWDGKPDNRKGKVGVHLLMGGEDAGEWDIYPEEKAILIGTQDMLLSRALNRGYGMSRYRWPMHFGLLNNDCLWVLDETQLMGVGIETTAQLDGFRHGGKIPTVAPCPTWWMSATLDESRLATVDHPKPDGNWPKMDLSDSEKTSGKAHELITSKKRLLPTSSVVLNSAKKTSYANELAAFIKDRHRTGTLTLVVVNRVARAREIYEALATGKKPIYDNPNHVALIHSRFRPKDRKKHEELLFGQGDRIVIATQAVEAGVDVSARLLITELAPWSSLVQRMGRCNRRADIADAEVLWVDIEPDAKGDLPLPYSKDELDQARAELLKLTGDNNDASPAALSKIQVAPKPIIRPVIRRRDLVDLFDTTPDICGQDLDISRYIRDGEDSDVQFFWRDVTADAPDENEPQPERAELCRVSIAEAAKFLKSDKVRSWCWNPLDKEWKATKLPRPGAVYLLASSSGGYEDELGWTGETKVKKLTTHRPPDQNNDSYDGDPNTYNSRSWQTIAEHTKYVVQETAALAALPNEPKFTDALCTAALWHDIGKAHEEFQRMLRHCDPAKEGTLWAKSANKDGKCDRYGFRHELASALAWLLADTPNAPGKPGSRERDLVAYLIAAHHGKVRLSIRSLPDEKGDDKNQARLFARGIWDGEILKPVSLGELTTPEIPLDLSFMQMGEGRHGSSWLARAVALRDQLGPFRLAYLETLLRAADARASKQQAHATNACGIG